jgi:hypothetical protein
VDHHTDHDLRDWSVDLGDRFPQPQGQSGARAFTHNTTYRNRMDSCPGVILLGIALFTFPRCATSRSCQKRM